MQQVGVTRFLIAALLMLALVLPMVSKGQYAVSSEDDAIKKARGAYNDRRFVEAASLYSDYLSYYPEGEYRDEAGFFQGHSLFLSREYEKGQAVLLKEEAVNRTYSDQILFYLGEIAAVKKDYNQALVYYDRLIAEYPGSMMSMKAERRRAEVNYLVANRYLATNAPSLALQHYQQAMNSGTELEPLVLYKLGLVYKKMGEPEKALDAWGSLSLQEGEDAIQAALLARYSLARLQEDRFEYAEAEYNFQLIAEKYPLHYLAPLAEEGLARTWAKQGKVDQAMEYWSKKGEARAVIGQSETYARAMDHFLLMEYADAASDFSSVLINATDPELVWKSKLWMARAHHRAGRSDLALPLYNDVLKQAPSDYIGLEYARFLFESDPAAAYQAASVVADKQNEFENQARLVMVKSMFAKQETGAADAAAGLLARNLPDPDAGELYLLKGLAHARQGDTERAEQALLKAIELHPRAEGRFEAALILSRVYREAGRVDSANQALLKVEPEAARLYSPPEMIEISKAEASYARGEYEAGVEKYETLCQRPAGCTDEVRFRLFWGYFKVGRDEEALAALATLAEAGPEWAFEAGFYRGVVLLDSGQTVEAFESLKGLASSDHLERGMLLWEISRAQIAAGSGQDAMRTLADAPMAAPGAGLFVRGEILRLALETGDFQTYLSSLPEPETVDRTRLSEEALVSSIRDKARMTEPPVDDIEELLALLTVLAVKEESVEEGQFLLAEAMLSTPERKEGLSMMSKLLADNPATPFAAGIKFYHGEDAFLRKDYQGAVSWLRGVSAADLPEKYRFRLLYLQGQAHKMNRDLENARPYFLTLVNNYTHETAPLREWLDVGVGLVLSREYTAAQTALNIVTENAKDKDLMAQALYWKGMGQQGAGDLDSALATFLSLAEDYPDQGMWVTTALYEAAHIYTQQGEYDKALELYDKILARTKGDKKTSDQVRAKIAEVKKLKSLKGGGLFSP